MASGRRWPACTWPGPGLKTPLPRDFDLSYDVVAAKDYRWGARGLTMRLSKAPAAGVW